MDFIKQIVVLTIVLGVLLMSVVLLGKLSEGVERAATLEAKTN